ncbi:uncharacterized protein [Montipora capricornis]|uniref:uncharacterized protein n=1 Tax=Montipora foliosa TaxID=591990 RepID=UPI0035F1D548
MKTCLFLIFCVGLTLAQDPPPPPPPNTLPPSPTKHPYTQCLDTYDVCMKSDEEPDKWKCFNAFYTCQTDYRRKCRKLYEGIACQNLLGKDECKKRLYACFSPEEPTI